MVWPAWAHPRESGADLLAWGNGVACVGSSPRVRGRLVPGENDHVAVGLIPASAGQTCCYCDGAFGADGSSPRVRGRPDTERVRPGEPGLIPASAGQTRARRMSSSTVGAHPRECGADAAQSSRTKRTCGSSPRVRGRLHGRCVPRYAHRLIPASAGQTDHPDDEGRLG